jgi:PAS domain S-box-containing protein
MNRVGGDGLPAAVNGGQCPPYMIHHMNHSETSITQFVCLIDALQCGCAIIDRAGRIVHANPKLCQMLGRGLVEVLGVPLRELYREDRHRRQIDAWLEAFEVPHDETEFVLPRPDGSELPVLTMGRPLAVGDGPPRFRVSTIIDIGQQKEMLRQMAALSDVILEQARELKHHAELLEQRVRQRTEELQESNLDAIYMLAVASEAKDLDTGTHVRRIERLARAVSLELGLSQRESERIGYSAILHDVGKMHIPDQILQKPGPLTPQERSIMQTHTIVGESILSRRPFFETARQIARGHHENWDGTGYPDGLRGESIPLCARIVHVADVFDALTARRAYKEPWPVEDAVAEILDKEGAAFDPAVIHAFEGLHSKGALAG